MRGDGFELEVVVGVSQTDHNDAVDNALDRHHRIFNLVAACRVGQENNNARRVWPPTPVAAHAKRFCGKLERVANVV